MALHRHFNPRGINAMSEINTRNPKHFEIVGSKDLRESFKDQDRIRGSFFINNVEMHQFEANSPASVVHQINHRSSAHFVHAEIDDGGHLVLVDKSGAPIMIRAGAAYVEPGPQSTGDVAKDVLSNLKHESEKRRREDKNDIIEALGLESTDKGAEENGSGDRAGFETGRSAEEREKARAEGEGRHDGPAGSGINRAGATQIPSNPTPGDASGAGGKLDDGRGRTGTGGGSGETSASTIQGQTESRGPNRAA